MADKDKTKDKDILALVGEIVAAHVSNNTVPAADLPKLIKDVHSALIDVGSIERSTDRPRPAVPISRSVTPDYIVCLEDGRKLKMLKRHLRVAFNMSPEEYRERWGLPLDYPMVAANYAKRRSSLAKDIGLGRSKKTARGSRRRK